MKFRPSLGVVIGNQNHHGRGAYDDGSSNLHLNKNKSDKGHDAGSKKTEASSSSPSPSPSSALCNPNQCSRCNTPLLTINVDASTISSKSRKMKSLSSMQSIHTETKNGESAIEQPPSSQSKKSKRSSAKKKIKSFFKGKVGGKRSGKDKTDLRNVGTDNASSTSEETGSKNSNGEEGRTIGHNDCVDGENTMFLNNATANSCDLRDDEQKQHKQTRQQQRQPRMCVACTRKQAAKTPLGDLREHHHELARSRHRRRAGPTCEESIASEIRLRMGLIPVCSSLSRSVASRIDDRRWMHDSTLRSGRGATTTTFSFGNQHGLEGRTGVDHRPVHDDAEHPNERPNQRRFTTAQCDQSITSRLDDDGDDLSSHGGNLNETQYFAAISATNYVYGVGLDGLTPSKTMPKRPAKFTFDGLSIMPSGDDSFLASMTQSGSCDTPLNEESKPDGMHPVLSASRNPMAAVVPTPTHDNNNSSTLLFPSQPRTNAIDKVDGMDTMNNMANMTMPWMPSENNAALRGFHRCATIDESNRSSSTTTTLGVDEMFFLPTTTTTLVVDSSSTDPELSMNVNANAKSKSNATAGVQQPHTGTADQQRGHMRKVQSTDRIRALSQDTETSIELILHATFD